MYDHQIGLFSSRHKPVPLMGVAVKAEILNTAADVSVVQSFCNRERGNIEAVYTFALPIDAVLMDLKVALGEKTLQGTVTAKESAEKKYAKAIKDGDMAVMLEKISTGLYTLNIGNLVPEEVAHITYRYAQNLRWNGNSVRFHLPTTIAPRYGDTRMAGLKPRHVPEFAVNGDNRFSINVKVKGVLADTSAVVSPSHRISCDYQDDSTAICIADGNALMDRDFIVVFNCAADKRDGYTYQKDFEGYAAMAGFCPSIPDAGNFGGRSIKILVDCSGSMEGESIKQARIALDRIFNSLKENDYFNVTLFGSYFISWFPKQAQATENNVELARLLLTQVSADMGGTELGRALEKVYSFTCDEIASHDVLLITDGEVWDDEAIVQNAVKSEHRIFSVGVGNAVAEDVVRSLAEQTGGMCELVSPNEQMGERIHRHFMRISPNPVENVEVVWPQQPCEQFPAKIRTLFHEDTLLVFARFNCVPEGQAVLKFTMSDGTIHEQAASAVQFTDSYGDNVEVGLIPRLVAASELAQIEPEKDRQEVAVKYQLMSDRTNYFLIEERDRDADLKNGKLPNVRKVPQNLAAGWHGTAGQSRNIDSEEDSSIPCYLRHSTHAKPYGNISDKIVARKSVGPDYFLNAKTPFPTPVSEKEFIFHDDDYTIPSFLCKEPADMGSAHSGIPSPVSLDEFGRRLCQMLEAGKALEELRMWDLQKLGLEKSYLSVLERRTSKGAYASSVINAFLYWLIIERMDSEDVPRTVKREVLRFYNDNQIKSLVGLIRVQAEKVIPMKWRKFDMADS